MRLLRLALLLALPALVAGAGEKSKRVDTYALVSGTVFRDTGLTLAGAEVILAPPADSGKRAKKLTATSDARGEFAFRVPPVQSEYTLTVRAKGYQEQQKPVTITGEDRIDVFFRLDSASK